MESIYEYIDKNIKANGMLKDNFNLDKYTDRKPNEIKFALGTLDGISYFHSKNEVDEEQLEFLKKILKLLQEDSTALNGNLINEYYKKTGKMVLLAIDSLLSWIIENAKKIDNKLLFELAIYLMMDSTNTEAVKIGIAIIGLIDFSDKDELVKVIEKLALCDEFTLYANIALSNLPNINDIRFMLVKKVNGWGKIYLVNSLKNENESINEWLITNGCDNEIALGYLAYEVAEKIDLLKVLKRADLSDEEFKGVCIIMEGLIAEEPFKGISCYENYIEIYECFLEQFEKHIDNIDYYNIPIMISMYLFNKEEKSKQDIEVAEKIVDLLDGEKVYNTLKKEIVEGNRLKQVIDILKYNSKIELIDEIFEKFKENPFERYYCLEYLLQKEEYLDKSIDMLKSSINLQEHYSNPETIMELADEYSNNLVFIIQILRDYPFKGAEFIVAGLKSKIMQPRNASLNTIKEWKNRTNIDITEFPNEIYKSLLELKEKEMIKNYKIAINNLLGINEDLSNYEEPEIYWNDIDEGINIDIYSNEIEDLFETQIKIRGKDYYSNNMVYSCTKSLNKYTAFVQGTEFGKEYEVNIIMNKNNKIQKIECNCPYPNNCKHEYATILYIRDRYKNKMN